MTALDKYHITKILPNMYAYVQYIRLPLGLTFIVSTISAIKYRTEAIHLWFSLQLYAKLAEKTSSLCHQIRSRPETNHDSLTQMFQLHVFAWVLIDSLDCLCFLRLVRVITLVLILTTLSWKWLYTLHINSRELFQNLR